MKYTLLPALTLIGITVLTTGCMRDVTAAHDIYRTQYKYKPLPEASPALAPTTTTTPPAAQPPH